MMRTLSFLKLPDRDAVCVAAILALSIGTAHAVEPISTDRPDVVESSTVLEAGSVQLETSIALAREARHEPRLRERSTPSLLRIGLGHDVELRVETDGLMHSRYREDDGTTRTDTGTADTALGLKWHVQDGGDTLSHPSLAWLVHVDTPSGTRPYHGQGLRPSLRMVAEWEWGPWGAGVMPGAFVEHDDAGHRYVGGIFAAMLGRDLTDRLRGFVELSAAQLAKPEHGGNDVSIDGGLAYLLSDTVQIDMAVARGLSDAAPRQQWTMGLSIRWD